MLDADSTKITPDSRMNGLAGKFEREGFQGRLWFLQGGHAVLRSSKIKLVTEEENGEESNVESKGFMAGKLGSLAFQQGELDPIKTEYC